MKQLVINLDSGPECNGHRSQFLFRMTEFADMTGRCVRLVNYPPYHSKYNGIERYWAGLERLSAERRGYPLALDKESRTEQAVNLALAEMYV